MSDIRFTAAVNSPARTNVSFSNTPTPFNQKSFNDTDANGKRRKRLISRLSKSNCALSNLLPSLLITLSIFPRKANGNTISSTTNATTTIPVIFTTLFIIFLYYLLLFLLLCTLNNALLRLTIDIDIQRLIILHTTQILAIKPRGHSVQLLHIERAIAVRRIQRQVTNA